jgi:hypothetical protein
MVRNSLGILTCLLLAACADPQKKVFSGPDAGLEYRNQNTAPWPWVSVVPSERSLAFQEVDFNLISQQLHFDMAFEEHQRAFRDVRVVVLDYTFLPENASQNKGRPQRYFMNASFYKLTNRPPCPPDFEVTTTFLASKAPPQEAMLFMARDIMEEIHCMSDDGLLTPGRKIMVNLD